MGTLPTPSLKNASVAKNMYRGFAMSQLQILKRMMTLGGLKIAQRIIRVADGAVITCSKVYNLETVDIDITAVGVPDLREVVSITGYILQPRSGPVINLYYYIDGAPNIELGVVGGWANGRTVLTTEFIFPLIDNDKASFVYGTRMSEKYVNSQKQSADSFLYYAFDPRDNYGNLYWHNDASYNKTTKRWDKPFLSLSWAGTPTRHGRVPSNYNIPGLSAIERALGLDDDVYDYTTFWTALYSGGRKIADAPTFSWPAGASQTRGLILGAAITSDGHTHIITQNDHQIAPKYVWYLSNGENVYGDAVTAGSDRVTVLNSTTPAPNPLIRIVKRVDLTKPGFFIGVWSNKLSGGDALVVDGWELLSEVSHPRTGLPWFGNAAGTSFVCSNGDRVDIAGATVTYIAYTRPAGSKTQTLSSDIRSEVTHTFAAANQKFFHEYAVDTLVSGVAGLTFSSATVQGHGAWGNTTIDFPDAIPITFFENYVYTFTDTSVYQLGVREYCYTPVYFNFTDADLTDVTTYPHIYLNNVTQPNEYTGPGTRNGHECIGVDGGNTPWGKGVIHTIHSQGSLTNWDGSLQGSEHTINTDFTIAVCGVNIPIIRTNRHFKSSRTPHATQEAEIAGYVKCWISENCDIKKTTIHFLDERYGVCLYKTTHDIIDLPQKQSQEVDHYIAYGTTARSATIIIRPSDYTATTTEEWHLVIDGVDTVVATTTLAIYPFGEPMHNTYYTDVCKVFCMPKIPASSSVAPSSPDNPTNAAAGDFGCYEDGYDDPYGAQAQADGGIDYFYPEWCRSLQQDPFWASVAGSRYNFTAPGALYPQAGTTPYTPPEVVVEPIPIGSFARHPMLNDMYQFLITKFNGSHIVISSADINAKIDDQLALAKDTTGHSLGLATHDTTLYYPISLI